jgi:hypothetical protein
MDGPIKELSFLGGTDFESGRQRSTCFLLIFYDQSMSKYLLIFFALISTFTQCQGNWIASYTMILIWMLMLMLLYLVDGQRKRPAQSMTSARPVEGRPVTEVTTIDVYDKPNSWADKFRRAVRAARLSFILLLSATLITALGLVFHSIPLYILQVRVLLISYHFFFDEFIF